MPARLYGIKNSTFFIFSLGILFVSNLFFFAKCSASKQITNVKKVSDPLDNPSSDEKIAFGRMLFFDPQLSIDGKVSCATCHVPKLAFSDGLEKSIGVFGKIANRNSPSLLNVGFQKRLMFDGELKTIEMQAIVPIQEHNEMGMDMRVLIDKLNSIPKYKEGAKKIFDREFDPFVLTRSLAAFQRSLISLNAPIDQYLNGNKKAISSDAIKGFDLFSNKFKCISCHSTHLYTSQEVVNNGIYENYEDDRGRFRIHEDLNDDGSFKIPSLRNISITAPYMHDGSFKNLDQIINHYASGGKKHKNQDARIKGFEISDTERTELKAFLNTLTDTSYLKSYR